MVKTLPDTKLGGVCFQISPLVRVLALEVYHPWLALSYWILKNISELKHIILQYNTSSVSKTTPFSYDVVLSAPFAGTTKITTCTRSTIYTRGLLRDGTAFQERWLGHSRRRQRRCSLSCLRRTLTSLCNWYRQSKKMDSDFYSVLPGFLIRISLSSAYFCCSAFCPTMLFLVHFFSQVYSVHFKNQMFGFKIENWGRPN